MAVLLHGQGSELPVVTSPCSGRTGLLEDPVCLWAWHKAALSPCRVACLSSLPQGGQAPRHPRPTAGLSAVSGQGRAHGWGGQEGFGIAWVHPALGCVAVDLLVALVVVPVTRGVGAVPALEGLLARMPQHVPLQVHALVAAVAAEAALEGLVA